MIFSTRANLLIEFHRSWAVAAGIELSAPHDLETTLQELTAAAERQRPCSTDHAAEIAHAQWATVWWQRLLGVYILFFQQVAPLALIVPSTIGVPVQEAIASDDFMKGALILMGKTVVCLVLSVFSALIYVPLLPIYSKILVIVLGKKPR